ncbi:HutD family protein [Ancylomarina sp. 16SWW S1-10-2]|uniref:HutD/Ves family protein n=1 Tax=Ancylomarina sp. 16SWW S1-10-2 TaxID=2499681 RepID=UPI0012AE69A7|nr:HutD family protein [Ancylomarina sp. 16SWW S1-10-2]MRT92374.1 hypothetical protein [Ancylomarina sp. 16SWW S1-10-2]
MSYSIIRADKFKTINWSGGISTQLYIYPETSDYALRNFDFRLSSAKVEVEKSDFTALPSVSRKIMILDGEIEISHKNHYTKKLQQFDVDEFEGDWQTSSIGICTDFNLMTRGNTKGQLSSISLLKNKTTNFEVSKEYSKVIVYLYSGKITFLFETEEVILNQGELLILDQIMMKNMKLTAVENSKLIVSEISI